MDLGAHSVAGFCRRGEDGVAICSRQSQSVANIRGSRRRFRFDESFEEDYDGR